MFTETHAHLDYPEFAQEIPALLERAAKSGIHRIISIGTSLESSARAVDLASRHDNIYAAVGWHPSHVLEAPDDIRTELRSLARHPKVVAIGETGLDYYRLPSTQEQPSPVSDEEYKRRQANLFEQQIEVARELGLNCVIHQRAASEAALKQWGPHADRIRGVFHCFIESAEVMRQIIALNSLVSFTGIVTFKNAEGVKATLAATPLDKLMLETDCPYLAPVPFRGKRSEPAHVQLVATEVARIKGITLEALSQATERTVREFFPAIK